MIPGELGFQHRLLGGDGTAPVIWVRRNLKCHIAVEWSLYAAIAGGRTPALVFDAGNRPCCHCAVEVNDSNGEEEWKKEVERNAQVRVWQDGL